MQAWETKIWLHVISTAWSMMWHISKFKKLKALAQQIRNTISVFFKYCNDPDELSAIKMKLNSLAQGWQWWHWIFSNAQHEKMTEEEQWLTKLTAVSIWITSNHLQIALSSDLIVKIQLDSLILLYQNILIHTYMNKYKPNQKCENYSWSAL